VVDEELAHAQAAIENITQLILALEDAGERDLNTGDDRESARRIIIDGADRHEY